MRGRVAVIHRRDATPAGFTRIYIGRPTALGNPFTHLGRATLATHPVATREEAVEAYRAWATDERERADSPFAHAFAALEARLTAGENLALECWCAPLACHGNVLAELLLAG